MTELLVVNVNEFADLCGVTSETMRVHLKAVDGTPDWLIERGTRGREYRIDARAGIAWWRKMRDDAALADADRGEQLTQLRLELTGGVVEDAEVLALSGKQRIQEYAAAEAAAKYRRMMGDLLDRHEVVRVLATAATELRRRLMQVPAEFAIREGLPPKSIIPLEGMLGRAVDDFLRSFTKETAVELPPIDEAVDD